MLLFELLVLGNSISRPTANCGVRAGEAFSDEEADRDKRGIVNVPVSRSIGSLPTLLCAHQSV